MKAIFTVENFIFECNPKTKAELEDAAKDIAHAAIAALISTMGPKSTKNFLKSEIKILKEEYSRKASNSYETLEGLH